MPSLSEREFWMRLRAHLIETEKALTMQRAAVIGEYKAIERMLGLSTETAPIETETLTGVVRYNTDS